MFPDELYQAPQSWAERAYPNNLIHYNRLDRGGHFAAWEQPQRFSEELRAAFRSLRKQHHTMPGAPRGAAPSGTPPGERGVPPARSDQCQVIVVSPPPRFVATTRECGAD